jgi:hypothetical protein
MLWLLQLFWLGGSLLLAAALRLLLHCCNLLLLGLHMSSSCTGINVTRHAIIILYGWLTVMRHEENLGTTALSTKNQFVESRIVVHMCMCTVTTD